MSGGRSQTREKEGFSGKRMGALCRCGLAALFAITLALVFVGGANADYVFVANNGSAGTVGEYTLSDTGAATTVNASLITGLSNATGVAVSGSNLYVESGSTVEQYTVNSNGTATLVNANLITGLSTAYSVAVSGNTLVLTNGGTGTVQGYTLAGATATPSYTISSVGNPKAVALLSGNNLFVAAEDFVGEYNATTGAAITSFTTSLADPTGIAVSGSNLFVSDDDGGAGADTVTEYTTSGGTPKTLISGLTTPYGIAVSSDGSVLYLTDLNDGKIGEYKATTGAAVSASAITGLHDPYGIAAEASVPVPPSVLLIGSGLLGLAGIRRRFIR